MIALAPFGPPEATVDVGALFWAGPEWDRARWRTAAGDTWLVRTRRVGGGRDLEQARVTSAGLAALDVTRFELDEDTFAEVARYREAGGPNLHPAAIRLPRRLAVGEAHAALPGATVTCTYAGAVRLVLDGATTEARGACLRAEAAGFAREQWLLEGVGEVAIGAPGAWERWLVAWTGGERALFGGVAPSETAAWPALPAARAADGGGSPGGPAPSGGVFG